MNAARCCSCVVALCCLTCCVGCGFRVAGPQEALAHYERSFLFYPSDYPEDEDRRPEDSPIEDVRFTSVDGTKLHGWYVANPNRKATVLYCHGNGGNVTHRVGALRQLHAAGASVFIFDYPGYGRSEGAPDETGCYAAARAARGWLAKKEGIRESDIVILGRSLGGAVAVELAANDGARALILESTFTSVPNMAKIKMPYVPVGGLIRNRFESIDKIGDYEGPLLMSHGEDDKVIPIEQGDQLFEAANEPKRFHRLPGKGHNEALPADYYRRLSAFLTRVGTGRR